MKTLYPIRFVTPILCFLGIAATGIFQLFSPERQCQLETKHWSPPSVTPNDWMAIQRIYPYDRINPEAVQAAYAQAGEMMKENSSRTTPWTFTGPT
ncbi:MAG: hypothetical protein V1733_10045, partial [bacterium]